MNKPVKTQIIIILITLIIGFLLGWVFFGEPPTSEHSHIEAIDGEKKWTCSMHPQIRQNETGNCPICGMSLIPLDDHQGDGIDPMVITMSPTAMQLANVVTAMVGSESATKNIRLNGKVQEDERLIFNQTTHFSGRIEKLSVNFTGEYVNKGSVVAYLYSPQLETAQEELLEAFKIRKSQPNLYQAAREKLKNWKLSGRQIDQILSSGKKKDQFPVMADQSGYVTNKKVNLGDYIKSGQTLYEIANFSRVWVQFDVYENDVPWVKKGDSIQFEIGSLPGKIFLSKIDYIDPVINPKTRVTKARVIVQNNERNLKPEMFVTGNVKTKLDKAGGQLTVPRSAVMWTGKRSVVYVKLRSDRALHFKMREVTLGPALGDTYVVEKGLELGEEIVVNGTFSIDAAAQLAGKPSMMNPKGSLDMIEHNHSINQFEVHSKHATYATKESISDQAKSSLQFVYDYYLLVKESLVNDDFSRAIAAAKKMHQKLTSVDMALFKGQSYQNWMQFQNDLNENLKNAEKSSNLEEFRISFQQLSNHMILMTKTFNQPFKQTLYILHCPMADNNQGADWLSTEMEVRNPYFGASMLKCGSVKQELN